MLDNLIFLLFGGGLLAVVVSIHRVLSRAGVGYDGIFTVSSHSSEQKRLQREKLWTALFDTRFRLDQVMLIAGGVALVSAIVVLTMIAS